MKRRGEIVNAYNWTERGQEVGVIIERNPAYRRRVSPRVWSAAGAALIGFLAVFVAHLLWEARNFLAVVAGAAFVLIVIGVVLHIVFGGGNGCSCVVHGKACR
jgi:small-conductance mechanosensitive channel